MAIQDFIAKYGLSPESVDGEGCLEALLAQMAEGLAGRGNIPMIPSYLSLDILPEPNVPCCVLDAGGTTLRIAQAEFQSDGSCALTKLTKVPMPGTQGELSADEFYGILAGHVRDTGCPHRVGLCFSYNVLIQRNLDGILQGWCKEVRVPDAPGKAVGAFLARAIGSECGSIRVLNDSTAALLGAHILNPKVTLGLILGTGINICYPERCSRISKVPRDLGADSMVISTEIGEFDGFPKTVFDAAVIAASDEPNLAHGEKQCSGAYLGQIISLAWRAAAEEGLLPEAFRVPVSLPIISDYLAGVPTALPENENAAALARTLIHRAAKIAAVLTAGPVLRSEPGNDCTLVIEGSQFHRLTGFGDCFRRKLDGLLSPRNITCSIVTVENSCLVGAALAAFAHPM